MPKRKRSSSRRGSSAGLSFVKQMAAYKRAKADARARQKMRLYNKLWGINKLQPNKFGYSLRSFDPNGEGNEQRKQMFGETWASATEEQRANRRKEGYYGRGLYTGRGSFGSFFRGIGRGIRRVAHDIAPYAKEAAKGAAMAYLGGGLYSGRGQYTPDVHNTLFNENDDPAMSVVGSGDETEGVTITHKEFIGDVYGPATTAFTNTQYLLNPGLSDQFPWLSQIAANYEEYEWEQLVFEYRSTIDSSTVTNGQTGTLIMATQYNLDNQPFSSKDEMMQYHAAMSSRLTDNMAHGVECHPNKNKGNPIRLVRSRPLDTTTQDQDEYDIGRFELAINNCPSTFANQAVGELWVYYRCRLLKPKLASNRGANIQYALFGCNADRGATAAGDLYGIGTGDVLTSLNSLNVSISRPAANQTTITFPAQYGGYVRIVVRAEGTTFAGSLVSTLTKTGNASFVDSQYATNIGGGDNPGNRIGGLNGTTNAIGIVDVFVRTATGGIDNSITLVDNLTLATVTQSMIEIVEIPLWGRRLPNDARPLWFNSNGQRVEMN